MDLDLNITFGAIAPYMSDPTIEEVWINSPERIFIARAGKSELTNLLLSADEVRNIVERALMWGGRRLDLSHPFVDARLPDGSRLHVAIPEITAQHWAVNIRKHLLQKISLAQLAERGVMTFEMAEMLRQSVSAGINILVSGGTQAGKTTLLCALIAETNPSKRLVTVEETFEIRAVNFDWVALQTRQANLEGRGEVSLRRLVKESLRMRPELLVVGEVREAESLDLLIAMNSGLPGLCTIHANSAAEAVQKLCTLPLLAGANISAEFVKATVANCIDIVVHCEMLETGQRRVSQIAEVNWVAATESPSVELIDMGRSD